jgi:hypothetical protein
LDIRTARMSISITPGISILQNEGTGKRCRPYLTVNRQDIRCILLIVRLALGIGHGIFDSQSQNKARG